jgi:hypothetical protein
MTSVSLSASGQAALDASGNATVKLGPLGHGEVWHPQTASVHVTPKPPATTITKSPVCKVYVGASAGDSTFVDGTFTGEQDSTDNVTGTVANAGQFVWAVWTAGDVGATATLNVTGTKDVP